MKPDAPGRADPAVTLEGESHSALPAPSLPARMVAGTKGTFPRWWVAGVMASVGLLAIWRHNEPHIIKGPVLDVTGETMAQASTQVQLSASQGTQLTARG